MCDAPPRSRRPAKSSSTDEGRLSRVGSGGGGRGERRKHTTDGIPRMRLPRRPSPVARRPSRPHRTRSRPRSGKGARAYVRRYHASVRRIRNARDVDPAGRLDGHRGKLREGQRPAAPLASGETDATKQRINQFQGERASGVVDVASARVGRPPLGTVRRGLGPTTYTSKAELPARRSEHCRALRKMGGLSRIGTHQRTRAQYSEPGFSPSTVASSTESAWAIRPEPQTPIKCSSDGSDPSCSQRSAGEDQSRGSSDNCSCAAALRCGAPRLSAVPSNGSFQYLARVGG